MCAVTVCGAFLPSKLALGQVGAAPAKSPAGQDKYAAESFVLERGDVVYSMAADGTGWRERTIAVRVQSEAALKQLGVIAIPFAGASERVEIQYARARRPDGTVVETPVTDALELPEEVTREAPFYSDLKEKQLPIRNLRVGDTLEWKVRTVRTKAEAPGEFWGQENFDQETVALEESVELRVPKDKTVKVWSPTIKPVESVAGEERVYRWSYSQTKTTATQQAEAEAKKKVVWTAEQELDAKEGKLAAIAWTTFPSWEAVGAWYRGLEGDRMSASPAVKAKVAEVTAGKTTEEEKVRAVYGYVATQIRYIGVAFGVGRYQPHNAEEVLENQYGDCKDKHTLLAAMLGAAGVKTDAVLIGAGIRFNPEVPSPAAFNHLITLATVDGKPVWLDATAEVAPYRMLEAQIRDHRALAVPDAAVARIETTPKELPFKPFQTMDAVGTLNKDGVSESKMKLTLRGDIELYMRAVLRQIAPSQYDQLVQKISEGMGFGGTTSHAVVSRAEDTEAPLTIQYDYRREKVGDWENYRTLAQLAPVSLPIPDDKDPPVRSIELGYPHVETSTSALKLPEGWGAELPEAVHAHSAYGNWDTTYRIENGVLYAERKVDLLVDTVPQADWKSYKKWTNVTEPGTEKYVQLTRPKADVAAAVPADDPDRPRLARRGGGAEDTEGTESSNAKAAKLLTTAYRHLQDHEVKEAAATLDEAKTLNASQAGLWAGYAQLAFQRREVSEAILDYEKELAKHPSESMVYPALAAIQMNTGKESDGVATMRRWMAADPSNPAAMVMLVSTLLQQGDGPAALGAAEAGMDGLPEEQRKKESVQLNLGWAQLKGGQKEKGSATLAALLQTTDDPNMLNSAAYELAVAGEQLELGEKSVRSALQKMSDESKTWTLDENLTTLRAKSQLMAATWDTLGWILFMEKKPEDAENYLRAAWVNHPDAEVGEHMGDLLAAKKDRAGAMKMYELGLATIPSYNGLGVKRDHPTAQETKLREKLKAVGGTATKDPMHAQMDGGKALQEMRKIPLGAAAGHTGTAEYKLLISAEGVKRVERTGDKQIAGGDEMLMKAKMKSFLPEGSDARVVRAAILNCHQEVCELMLEP